MQSDGILADCEVGRVIHPRACVGIDAGGPSFEMGDVRMPIDEEIGAGHRLELTMRDLAQTFAPVASPIGPTGVRRA